jgi:nicotinamidase-related amidase
LQKARELGASIIFTREAHLKDENDFGLELEIGQPPHCVVGTEGFDIVSELSPLPNEIVIDKKRYDAFLGTPLDIYLRSHENPTIYITGFATNVCVHYTAVSAFQYDYRIKVLQDCVSATSQEKHEMGLRMLEFISPELIGNKRQFLAEIG